MKLIYLNKEHKTGYDRLNDIKQYNLVSLQETLIELDKQHVNHNHWVTCWGTIQDNKVATVHAGTKRVIWDSLKLNFIEEEPFFTK